MPDFTDLFLLLLFVVFLGVTVRICARDAIRRGKSPWAVTLLVLLCFPLGMLLWIVFRPDPIEREPENRFDLENHRVQ